MHSEFFTNVALEALDVTIKEEEESHRNQIKKYKTLYLQIA